MFNILRNFYQRLKARDAKAKQLRAKLKLVQKENLNLLKEITRLAEQGIELERALDKLREFEYVLTPPIPEDEMLDLTSIELETMIRDIFGNCLLYLADSQYKVPSLVDLEKFVEWAGVWKLKWEAEGLDCDAFTRALNGKLVAPEWVWIPPLDIWYDRLPGPFEDWHSVLLTVAYVGDTMRLYMVEGQEKGSFVVAEAFFDQSGVSVRLITQ